MMKSPQKCSQDANQDTGNEDQRPPLPPRPSALDVLQRMETPSLTPLRPKLVSAATTALSSTVIESQTLSGPGIGESQSNAQNSPKDSSTSVQSSLDPPKIHSPATDWQIQPPPDSLKLQSTTSAVSEIQGFTVQFKDSEIGSELQLSEEQLISQWKSRQKHFIILSQSGKPIWQRHGTDNLTSGYIGAIQTIISFYENSEDSLRSFSADGARFVFLAHEPLYLVAISKLGESDYQLRGQLEALYMQILSTLTLPSITRMFSLRPSTDLRRPLQGTENLLSALADTFTKGSPSVLLSSLECLKLRNRHRQAINDCLLKHRCPELLYGLVVAGGRLVSVVRPKTHSLHPSDLQLIFNMLFEAGGIQSGGGEGWIPMCLPGFNRNGYLYMYVSYLDSETGAPDPTSPDVSSKFHRGQSTDNLRSQQSNIETDQIVVLLISSKKEAFFELQSCRDAVVASLSKAGLLKIIHKALIDGRPRPKDVTSNMQLRHFLYKSRGNLQFIMPSWSVKSDGSSERRPFMGIYENLHTNLHAKGYQIKVQHLKSHEASSLAWITDVFELYCIATSGTAREVLCRSANSIVQWVKKEEERLFIIGGAVF